MSLDVRFTFFKHASHCCIVDNLVVSFHSLIFHLAGSRSLLRFEFQLPWFSFLDVLLGSFSVMLTHVKSFICCLYFSVSKYEIYILCLIIPVSKILVSLIQLL